MWKDDSKHVQVAVQALAGHHLPLRGRRLECHLMSRSYRLAWASGRTSGTIPAKVIIRNRHTAVLSNPERSRVALGFLLP